MKPKIIIFLLLLAGVGTQAKAQGTPGGQNITFWSTHWSTTVDTKEPLRVAFQYRNEIDWWGLICKKYPYGITCEVSDSQAKAIATSVYLASWPIENQNEPSFSMLRSSIAGAIVGASAVGIVELLSTALRYSEERRELPILSKRHSDSALGARHSLRKNRYFANLVELRCFSWLIENLPVDCITFFANHRDALQVLEITSKVVIGSLFGAVVGLMLALSRPPTVLVLLEATYIVP